MHLLRHPNIFTCDAALQGLRLISALPIPPTVPPSLEPTSLQRTNPHPPWIDLFPFSRARDALIRELGYFDERELCIDILGTHVHAKYGQNKIVSANKEDQNGVIIWGDPWNPKDWEVSEGFVQKWGWTLSGCWEEVLEYSNSWRRMRGDEELVWQGKERWETLKDGADRVVEVVE